MTDPTDALDSCPFCGNANAIMYDDLLTFHVGCLSCGATGSASSYRNGAIAAWNRRTPQPAQAADSVLEDAARLDWLDQQREAYGFQDIHEGNRWEISGAYANVREAIDAARKQGANHD